MMSPHESRTAWNTPVVRARVDSPLSRGLWLVKWVLLIPHYLVLTLLWVAFVVVVAMALVAILFTGRFPRDLFDFNLGVLRWSWRVAWYGYSGLGTDRYPPFTMSAVPDYPATLDIPYPKTSPRGRSLLQSWLLPAPHYMVIAVLVSGARWAVGTDRVDNSVITIGAGGLVSLLAFFVGVVLLTGRRYPADLFGLLVGLDRYVLRVVAYASLMTTAYPPFRLDQGGDEPSGPSPDKVTVDTEKSTPAGAPPASGDGVDPAEGATVSRTGPVIARVVGVLVLLTGLALSGLGAVGLHASGGTASEDFVSSPSRLLETPTAAITTDAVEIEFGADPSTFLPDRWEQVRFDVASTGDTSLFVGIASRSDVETWLGGIAHDQVRTVGLNNAVRYDRVDGRAESGPPAAQNFWVAEAAGTGTLQLVWGVESGEWVVVVTNTDGTTGVAADVSVAARAQAVAWVSVVVLVTGTALVLIGLLLLVLGMRSGRSRGTTALPREDTMVAADHLPSRSARLRTGSFPLYRNGRSAGRTGIGAGLGVAIGASLGITVGVLTDGGVQLATWIAVGAGVGVALGATWDSQADSADQRVALQRIRARFLPNRLRRTIEREA